MKHFLVARNSEKLSLVFAGENCVAVLILSSHAFDTGFKNVYDQQMLKPAYPMAFFYVKVHNPSAVDGGSSNAEPDQEFV
jgi:hypothetical protein